MSSNCLCCLIYRARIFKKKTFNGLTGTLQNVTESYDQLVNGPLVNIWFYCPYSLIDN